MRSTLLNFLARSREVRRETGKPAWAQLAQIARLRLSRRRLGLAEYYDYRVYRHADPRARAAFVGWRRAWRLQEALASPGWDAVSTDKLLFYSLCEAWGLPHPEVRAIFAAPNARHGGRMRTLATLDEVRAFLASPDAGLPLFVKPIRSLTGLGGAGIAAFDPDLDRVALTNGAGVALAQVLLPHAGHKNYWPAGCLFQALMRPHAEVARRTGDRLCTARVAVLLERAGPRIVHANFRVARGSNMVDNTRHGELGNSFGAVDPVTGVVCRQVLNAGFRETEIRLHPDTGAEIVGFRLPDWDEARDLCHRAALCFGGFRLQGWDVAFTDRGPMLVELNAPFDIDAAQTIESRGMWDDSVDRILQELGTRP